MNEVSELEARKNVASICLLLRCALCEMQEEKESFTRGSRWVCVNHRVPIGRRRRAS